jgi:hypothetical protein
LRQRVIALVAAYAIALSGLIAGFSGAAAAAEAASQPNVILCHSDSAGAPALPADQGNSKNCTEGCCIGCLMQMASLPPPPASPLATLRIARKVLHPVAVAVSTGVRQTGLHRSRAPPLTA